MTENKAEKAGILMNKPQNPFIYGPPVPPKKFIGRETEVEHILGRLANPFNRGGSMVSGPSGIGKTSLLHYLFAEDTRRRWPGLGSDVVHCVWIHGDLLFPFTEVGFWEFLFDALEDWLGLVPNATKIIESLQSRRPPSRFSISNCFSRLGSNEKKFVVVLLDGFDLLMREIIKDDSGAALGFLHTLRALLNLPAPRGFSLITSSEQDLVEIFKDVPWFGSDFCNNMVHLPLGPFDEMQIADLIDSYLAGTGVDFDDKDRRFLQEVSSGHPEMLQQTAYLLFDKKLTLAREIGKSKAKDTFKELEFDINIESDSFDVFLAHNNQDKPLIETIAKALTERGLKPWFDKWHLPPGRRFAEEIERVLPKTESAAVFVGTSAIGPWQEQEIYVLLDLFAKDKRPIIPVLLPGVEREPELPLFLRQFRWVRFATGINDHEAIDQLVWGISGSHPRGIRRELTKAVEEACALLAEIDTGMGKPAQTEIGLRIEFPDGVRAALKAVDLRSHRITIDEINRLVDELKAHKQKIEDFFAGVSKLKDAANRMSALKQVAEHEEALRNKSLLLKQHLEELFDHG